jgi:hypothetical protein
MSCQQEIDGMAVFVDGAIEAFPLCLPLHHQHLNLTKLREDLLGFVTGAGQACDLFKEITRDN